MKAGDSNFNFKAGNIGRKPATPAAKGPKQAPASQEQQTAAPTESVTFGEQPVADAKADTVKTSSQEQPAYVAPKPQAREASIPGNVDGLGLIAGVSGAGGPKKASFPGLTAVHGLGSTTLTTLSGHTVASASPLAPKTSTPVPTTSLSAVNDTFGGGPFFSVSGRQLG